MFKVFFQGHTWVYIKNLTLPVSILDQEKINLNFYFHTSLWCVNEPLRWSLRENSYNTTCGSYFDSITTFIQCSHITEIRRFDCFHTHNDKVDRLQVSRKCI